MVKAYFFIFIPVCTFSIQNNERDLMNCLTCLHDGPACCLYPVCPSTSPSLPSSFPWPFHGTYCCRWWVRCNCQDSILVLTTSLKPGVSYNKIQTYLSSEKCQAALFQVTQRRIRLPLTMQPISSE